MRAFVAIDLPEPIRNALAEAQARFRSSAPDARWVRPEGIHLTLKFLGKAAPETIEKISERLRVLAHDKFAPFRVEIRGFGFFPIANRPRVFWAGVEAPPALGELASNVEAAAAELGFPREPRPYRPHLTLARFKEPRPQPQLEKALEQQKVSSLGAFEVTEFFLIESRLSPSGAEYRKVARFP